MSAVLSFPVRRSLGHVESDLARQEREDDEAVRLEQHKTRFEASVHAALRAEVLAAFALGNTKAPIPNYAVTGFGSQAKAVERMVKPFDVVEEVWTDAEFQTLVLEMLADNCLPAQKARLRAARLYADANASGVAEARNWGLS